MKKMYIFRTSHLQAISSLVTGLKLNKHDQKWGKKREHLKNQELLILVIYADSRFILPISKACTQNELHRILWKQSFDGPAEVDIHCGDKQVVT